MNYQEIEQLLGKQAQNLLGFNTPKISKDRLHLPGPKYVDEVFSISDRPKEVVSHLKKLFGSGRLKNTGYLNILPVDQGIEHAAGYSFAPNPDYFDPENIVKLAIEGGCNGVASSLGVLGAVAKKYADKIPFIVKLNHHQILTQPIKYDQVLYATPEQAKDMGALGVGATVYFGSPEADRQMTEVSQAFAQAHRLGLFTVLWCYPRNKNFIKGNKDYHTAADITGQANYLGVTIEADIIKQKLPTLADGFKAIVFGKYSDQTYHDLLSDHPIDLTRYQVANCYMGRIGLLNSGGPSGQDDLAQAVTAAVINKRAGGIGLISGRKAFSRPLAEGVELLHAIQDVYLEKKITIA